MRFSLFRSAFETKAIPQTVECTWEEFQAEFESGLDRTPCAPCPGHDCEAKYTQLWSPVTYRPGTTRGNDGVEFVTTLVFDLDAPKGNPEVIGPAVAALLQALEGNAYFVHGSHSYSVTGNVRIVLPFHTPCPVADFPRVWRAARATLCQAHPDLDLCLDKHCKDVSRGYFTPSAPEGAHTFFQSGTGAPVDWTELLSFTPVGVEGNAAGSRQTTTPTGTLLPPVQTGAVDLDEIRNALRRVRKPEHRQIVISVLNGEPLAQEGGRDTELQRASSLVATVAPSGTPVETLMAILSPSMDRMPLEPEGRDYWDAEVRDMLERALERKAGLEKNRVDRKLKALERVKSAALGGAPSQAPSQAPREPETEEEPEGPPIALAYIYGWDKYAARVEGKWDLLTPLTKAAAKSLLEFEVLPDLLKNTDPRSELYDDLRATKKLPEHPCVVQVHTVDCAPGEGEIFNGPHGRSLNTWVPPELVPKKGQWPRIKRMMEYLTESEGTPDPAAVHWLTHWMAAKIQRPGEAMLTAPIFVGSQGSGKGTLIRVLQEALGGKNCAVIDQNSLENGFNGHWATKLLVFADDCIPANASKDLSGKLKTAITGENTILNTKGVNQVHCRNRAAWVFAANASDPVHIEQGDRRYSLFENRSPVTERWREFAAGFWENGRSNIPTPEFMEEIAAFVYDMLQVQVDWRMLRLPYQSVAREASIDSNLDSASAFIRAADEYGFDSLAESVADKLDCPMAKRTSKSAIGAVTSRYVMAVYRAWCEAHGHRVVTANKLGRELTRTKWRRGRVPEVVYWPPAGRPIEEESTG